MKSVLVCILLLLAAATSYSQPLDSIQPTTSDMYLTKSKHQKTAGWIMLAGGAAMSMVASIKLLNDPLGLYFYSPSTDVVILSLLGTGSMLGSIPFFRASARNKWKASKLSTGLTMQQTIVPIRTGFFSHSTPALSLQVHF